MVLSKNSITAKKREAIRNRKEKFFASFRVFSWLKFFQFLAILICAAGLFAGISDAQTKKPTKKTPAPKKAALNLPKVAQIDAEKLRDIIKPNGKPLLINFWATWCEPCREEFPDLVKIGADYKDKIDLKTVSLDDLAEIRRDVPKFLAQMKSDSPAYLLKTPDEGAAMAIVTNDWQGALPFTILFDASGATIYSKQGKFKTEVLRQQIENSIK